MIKPEQLASWQPNASEEKLAKFIDQNSTLLILLEEAWEKFDKLYQDPNLNNHNKNQEFTSEYAKDVSIDDLEHFPITPEEMAAFLNVFDKNREEDERHARPFQRVKRSARLPEPDWEILDN